jgi:hypothetical protein
MGQRGSICAFSERKSKNKTINAPAKAKLTPVFKSPPVQVSCPYQYQLNPSSSISNLITPPLFHPPPTSSPRRLHPQNPSRRRAPPPPPPPGAARGHGSPPLAPPQGPHPGARQPHPQGRVLRLLRHPEVGGWAVRRHDLVPGVREGARGVELREEWEPRVPPHRAAPEAGARRRGGSPAEEAHATRHRYE